MVTVFGSIAAFLSIGFGTWAVKAAESTVPAAQAAPVLVELFTSEGCSSCPPADHLLQQLDGRRSSNGARVIGISEHVTYWDHLGWKDRFSSSDATERQSAYGYRFHLESVYTPQVVVNGREQMVGSDTDRVRRAIEAQSKASMASLHIKELQAADGGITFHVECNGIAPEATDLYAVVAQDMASTPVQRGENSGHTLTHVSIARSFVSLGAMTGDGAFHLSAAELQSTVGQKRHLIVFAQSKKTGPVLASDSIAL